jgi:hypothetical protein
LIDHHDLPLYRISHPPFFYQKNSDPKIQAAYDRWLITIYLCFETRSTNRTRDNRSKLISGIECGGITFPQKQEIEHADHEQPDGKVERDPRSGRDPGIVNGKIMDDRPGQMAAG